MASFQTYSTNDEPGGLRTRQYTDGIAIRHDPLFGRFSFARMDVVKARSKSYEKKKPLREVADGFCNELSKPKAKLMLPFINLTIPERIFKHTKLLLKVIHNRST